MEELEMTANFWHGKSVFLTGHTGFKGAWLALWLQQLGAQVHGYALAPQPGPSLFDLAQVERGMASHTLGDIRDAGAFQQAIAQARPQIVLHLAAQALVRRSYVDPAETYSTNVMGTVNLFEGIRRADSVRAVVNVTTDKCYENREWAWPYREIEALGGYDPYSSSKACSELVTAAYRQSFFNQTGVGMASARAGNVIGGGDWSIDRLIPDILRAFDSGQALRVRSPGAIRPWQHVLDPLAGYLKLAERVFEQGEAFAQAWNFGPQDTDARSVGWIIERMQDLLPGLAWEKEVEVQPHEAHYLRLDSSKAQGSLGWQPRWRLAEGLAHTVAWHLAWRKGDDMRAVSLRQIQEHQACAPLQ